MYGAPAHSYLSYDVQIEDSVEEMEESLEDSFELPKEKVVPVRKNLRIASHPLKDIAFGINLLGNFHDSTKSVHETISPKIRNLNCEEKEAVLVRLLGMLIGFGDSFDKLGHSQFRRSLDHFKGVKSLTELVKSVNPLEEAVNSEADFLGSSRDKTGSSVVKENAKNFLPSRVRPALHARLGTDVDECFDCSKSGAIKSLQKRSDEENDDFLNVEDPKEISTEATTMSASNTHHHRRKGSRKHLKPKLEHVNEESDKTLEPDVITSSSPKKASDENNVRSKKGSTAVTTIGTQKPHKEQIPSSHTKKNHTSASREIDHGKKGNKSTSLTKEHETMTHSTLEAPQGDITVLTDDGSQKMKDGHDASIIDSKPKFLKGSRSHGKGLHSDALTDNSPVEEESLPGLGSRPKSVQEYQGEKAEKMKESIEVGDMKTNIEPGDNKEGIKGPMMIDTKVLISGSNPKEVFSIGKMKGLLLLGESQDFVSGADEQELIGKKQQNGSKKQDESSEKTEADEDDQETKTKKKASGGQSKNLLPSERQKSFLDVLSGNVPFLGDETQGGSDNINDHHLQTEHIEAQNRTKDTGVKQITEIFKNKTAAEEAQRIHTSVDKDNISPKDSELNLSTSDKDTSSAAQEQSERILDYSEVSKGGALFAEDKTDLSPTNETKHLLSSKDSEVPSFPEAPNPIVYEENYKIFEDSESYFREIEHMHLTDILPNEKSLDTNEYSDQPGEKPRDSLQSDDIQTNEKHSEMSLVKEAETMPAIAEEMSVAKEAETMAAIAEEVNTDSGILTDTSKSKIDDLLLNMEAKEFLDDKIPKAEQDLTKKDEDYGPQKPSAEFKETSELSPNDERHMKIFEEFDTDVVGKTGSEESGKLPAVEESFISEGDDVTISEPSVNAELEGDLISPDIEPKDLVASGRVKGFMPPWGNPNRPWFPQRNRYFMPEEKSLPKDDTLIQGFPQLDKDFTQNDNERPPGNAFMGPVDSIPSEQPKVILPQFSKNGRNSENGRGRQSLGQQDDSRSNSQQANGNLEQESGSQRELFNSDKSESFMLQTDESRGMAQRFMGKLKDVSGVERGHVAIVSPNLPSDKESSNASELGLAGQRFMGKLKDVSGVERGHAPIGSPNLPSDKESSNASEFGSAGQSKKLQPQFPGQYAYPRKYPQHEILNAYNANPFAGYYGANKYFKENEGPGNPVFSGQESAQSKKFMPGFGGINY